jgi:mannose-6-phosphate isomerase-like protein (cupin superfamily)
MKTIFTFLILFVSISAQAQTWQNADTVSCPDDVENIYVRPLYSDSLSSSYVIFIKKQVKLHKHINHTEHVMVLAGSGDMVLGDKVFPIKKGDVVFIPKNTPHSVVTTSKKPLKVVSIQSPQFLGKDRVFLE